MWREETKADIKEREEKLLKEWMKETQQNQSYQPNHENINVHLPSWEDSGWVLKCIYTIPYVVYCCGCCTPINDWIDFVRESHD